MWQYTNTNELCHYGTKGMKWGKRKSRLLMDYEPANTPEVHKFAPGAKGYHTDPLQKNAQQTFLNKQKYTKQDAQSGKVHNDYTKLTQDITKKSKQRSVKKTTKRNVQSIVSRGRNRIVRKRAAAR